MKNMLLLAGFTTLFSAFLLVWMDNALANHLENTHPPETEKTYEQTLPEVTIRATADKMISLQLPEVTIKSRKFDVA